MEFLILESTLLNWLVVELTNPFEKYAQVNPSHGARVSRSRATAWLLGVASLCRLLGAFNLPWNVAPFCFRNVKEL